jgi:murein L,D-transpeptidase YafK
MTRALFVVLASLLGSVAVADTTLDASTAQARVVGSEGNSPVDVAQADALASSSRVPLQLADKVVVDKGARRLYLLRRGEILRSYKVALGLRPEGHKERVGDFRTPEGEYRLVRRNPHSDYFLSMQISYPNQQDSAHARRMGADPGGSIMIHGLPNSPRKPLSYYNTDWTDGCIAVSNSDMVEIWLMTPLETPIEIRR